MIGELKIIAIAAKLPEAAITACASAGVSRRTARIASSPSPAPRLDQRRLRAQHQPQPDRREAGEDDPRHLYRLGGGAADLEALGRDVAALTGQARDRQGDQQPGDRENEEIPPKTGDRWSSRDPAAGR